MRVTRRTFLKVAAASAAALGLSQTQVLELAEKVLANPTGAKVIWLQGQNCTGCTTAFANLEWDGMPEGLPDEVSTYLGLPQTLAGVTEPDSKTTLDDVLLDIINLQYLPTAMATGGEAAYNVLQAARAPGGFTGGVLIVEGPIPTNDNKYCTIANSSTGTPATELFIGDVVADIANAAKGGAAAVIAAGTCASFGGIPGANSDPAHPKTGAKGIGDYLKGLVGTYAPVVNVTGCNINPDWLFGTVVHYVLGDLIANLDDYGRPKFYYGTTVHSGKCPRYQAYADGQFATQPGENNNKCLAMLGCKGFSTFADCAFGGPAKLFPIPALPLASPIVGRGWNVYSRDSGRNPTSGNSCINNGYPCMGCTEKAYPDRFSPFFRY